MGKTSTKRQPGNVTRQKVHEQCSGCAGAKISCYISFPSSLKRQRELSKSNKADNFFKLYLEFYSLFRNQFRDSFEQEQKSK